MIDLLARLGVKPYYLNADQMTQRVAEDSKWISELMTELGFAKKQ